jgi:predicted nucleotidyltransferase|tara:strand:+ start:752 stop:1351 length:600 start_codon:yes stop_codon:yes gene_type:complete
MNQLLGKGKEKILECFYRNRYKQLYFSEILRETKLTQNTTLKHLKSLQENNLIQSTKETAHTFYKINNKNPQIYALFSYFDYKVFNELPSERKRAITDFLNALKTKPIISLIFGSTAKKTFTKESDIDVLLIFNKKETKQEKLRKDIEATTGFNIQTFIIDYEYFKEQLITEEDKVIIHAIKTGFVFTGHHYFYKEVLQ